MVRVSVIIPAFNCEKFIATAIESVCGQSFKNFEIIIVNDGSTDNTVSIIKTFAKQDSRIIIVDKINSGKPSIARNTGLIQAQGEYISFLDADDFYHLDKIKKSVELLDKYPEVVAAFNDMKLITKEGTEYDGTYLGKCDFTGVASGYLTYVGDNAYLCSDNFYCFMSTHFAAIHTNTIMIRRSVLVQQGLLFPTDVAIGEDTEMWLRLAKGRKLVFINDVLSYYRQHETSITKNRDKWFSDILTVHTRNYQWGQDVFTINDLLAYKVRIANEYFNCGYFYQSEFKLTEARQAYMLSLRWCYSFKALFAFFKTFVPSKVVSFLKGL